MKIAIPPIKCQGIKTKLVPTIQNLLQWNNTGRWIEPFMGSGVVGFNMRPQQALFCDNNPHLIRLYHQLNLGYLTAEMVRHYLEIEGQKLSTYGKDYYYEVRNRFNQQQDPLDFLFLNRSCFNGLIRFNRQGQFNVPFGHKPNRFSKAYITKIVNQVAQIAHLSQSNQWQFRVQDFRLTLLEAKAEDVIYCDPPYIGRHVGYFNTWQAQDELALYEALKQTKARFILSTWYGNEYRQNETIQTLWSHFRILTKAHFYHVGAQTTHRKPMIEAFILNFETAK